MWKVFVGNLDARIKERDLADKFSAYGLVRSIWVARRPPGYAFVEFDSRQEADDAISALDGKHGWRVELSKKSGGGHQRLYNSEGRCRECGSSRHNTRDCRPGSAKRTIIDRHSSPGRHRRSRSPRHGNSYSDRRDLPKKRERSISPEQVCIKISQNDEGNSPADESDAPRPNKPTTVPEPYNNNSSSDHDDSTDECNVPRKRDRERSQEHQPKISQNDEDSPHADENDAPKQHERNISPEHYLSSPRNDYVDECNVPRKRERRRSPERYTSRSPQNDRESSYVDESHIEIKRERSRSSEHVNRSRKNFHDSSDVDANERDFPVKHENSKSPDHEHNTSPKGNRDGSDGLSPASEERSGSRAPLLESSPEY